MDAAAFAPPNLSVVRGEALRVDLETKELEVKLTEGGKNEGKTARLKFDVLVAATGAIPKRLLPQSEKGEEEEEQQQQQPEHPRIVYLRDADSVAFAAASLRPARRVVVAGNGGIALGLAHALGSSEVAGADADAEERGSSEPPPPSRPLPPLPRRRGRRRRRRGRRRVVLWAAKHGHVGDAFFDVDAAAFLAKAIGRKEARKGGKERKGGGGEASGEERGAAAARPPPPPPPSLPTSLVPPRGTAAPAPSSLSPASSSSFSSAFGAAVGPGWVEALSGAMGSDGREEEKSAGGEEEEEDEEEEEEDEEEEGEDEEKGGIDLRLNATVTSVEDNERPSSPPLSSPSSPPFPLRVTLSDGSPPFECDAVVAAVGVRPDTRWLPGGLERSPADGGVLVDARMRSSAGPSLLACGDACTVREGAHGREWHQMRLWSQARATGAAAGRSAAGFAEDGTFLEEAAEGFDGGDGEEKGGKGGSNGGGAAAAALPPHSLELFAHATSVAGLRVILLGLYNGQGLEREPEEDIVTYCREEDGEGGSGASGGGGGDGGGGPFFARALLLRGRLAGAVLIGDTGLEGVFEDLIMDGIDVSFLGPRLLDPDLDLEAIFD